MKRSNAYAPASSGRGRLPTTEILSECWGGRSSSSDKNLIDLLETLDFPHVHPDHPLHFALDRMSAAGFDLLPVVNRADVHKLEGIVTLRDVLDSYGIDSTGAA